MSTRPLSPHLGIYRFAYTMAMSILHRATGLVLSMGLLLLIAFLAALAGGRDSYARFTAFGGSWAARGLFALLIAAFLYHLANGVRHLLWDAGIGLERPAARRSWKIVVAVVLAGSVLLCWLLLRGGHA
ncbi:MAG TPA: succinate dehydrogenase, cytochrome b556 subunit [Steroidobacteraceae bacterium]|nr:succinate dehydrogenase, cytochrome b556 subunit [Steroidobacteraceae bacterium]